MKKVYLLLFIAILFPHYSYSSSVLTFEINNNGQLSLESTNKKTISPKIFNDLRVTFDILSKIENKKDRFKKTAAVLNRLSKKAFFKTSKGINNKHVIFFDVNKGGKIRRRGLEISLDSELKSFDTQLHGELDRINKRK